MDLVGTLLLLGSSALAHDPVHDRFPAEAIRRVDIRLPAGDVTIRAVDPLGMMQVDGQPVDWGAGCSLEMAQDAERAWVHVTASTPLVRCRLDLAVVLAADTTVTVRIGHGDVRVIDLRGALTADLGAGDLILENLDGALDVEMGQGELSGGFGGPRLRAELGSGGVHLADLVAPADIELGMGNVELRYAHPPAGTIRARTGTGAVKVLLPEGTPIRADLTLGLGGKRVDLPLSEEAPTHVDLTTAVGKIVVSSVPVAVE